MEPSLIELKDAMELSLNSVVGLTTPGDYEDQRDNRVKRVYGGDDGNRDIRERKGICRERRESKLEDANNEDQNEKIVILLKGDPSLSRTEVSLKAMVRALQHHGQGVWVELCQTSTTSELSEGVHKVPKIAKKVLAQHQRVFGPMMWLPPSRDIDHAIQLILGTSPINVHPYQYPHILKNEIERLVQEMLEAGIVRPSLSPFSSPVLLIEKKYGERRPQIGLPPDSSSTTRHPQNDISHPGRSLRVLGDAFWANQCTNDLPVINEPYISATRLEIRASARQWEEVSLAKPQLEYLGHLVFAKGVVADPYKISAMVEWPTPKSPKELKGFLELIRQLFIVETDASGYGLGAVLMQTQRLVAYFSQVLSVRERQKSIYEKELMAIVLVVQNWHHYLLGHHFIVRTNQSSLKFLLEQRVVNESYQKWVAKLFGYDFEIQFRPELENKAADALSRIPISMELLADPNAYPQYSLDHGLLYKGAYFFPRPHPLFRHFFKRAMLARLEVIPSSCGLTNGSHGFFSVVLKNDIKELVEKCLVCQQNKVLTLSPVGLLQPLPIQKNMR
ncbi:Retrovirus-related Pol polyprotein from transposon 17.6 [Vitis vinifera]|uniref:Retrovirus-related Pol polyprotein from transposon 17.6 n=1 Tax=Vitis vinifera TaxID=29760 RepID=A0A438I886_VITVI|nr:Retrovirus-related Pol polyprotein from transposon 17.6 [Vitis vinifera]